MYTQCPDCGTAFRVTAEVLKQAAGKVRCGGCGNAFNALDYLSEQRPAQTAVEESNVALPELTPEIIETDNELLQSISAEQSAALLKTLDELAGSDIRIEDTGAEWRVLDEQETEEPPADDAAGVIVGDTPIDELLDDNPTPIDEYLTATPEVVDAPEIFVEAANGLAKSPVDEIRFDDNTPLPDDFDLDDESSYIPEPVSDRQPEPDEEQDEPGEKEEQPEIELSEPDEWTDILDEFEELIEEVAAPVDSAAEDEGDIAIEASGDQPLDMDTQFALQAEAMGIELSGIHELDSELEDEPEEEPELEDEPEQESDIAAELAQLEFSDDEEVLIEEPIVENHTIEDELEADGADVAEDAVEEGGSGGHYVAPMTEEEQTVNMLIDQDLMALAIEDEDGLASTIVIPEMGAEKKAHETLSVGAGEEEHTTSHEEPGFETIIMEGEFVRSAFDDEKLAADSAAAAGLTDLAHTKVLDHSERPGGARYGLVGGVVLLILLFAVQLIHQSREALATMPAFSNTIGQIYRAIGQPVQPAWDITGWRFEATKGSTEGEDEELTIYSRLGNKSDGALPYPLIGISLTDRFEETIGSRVLDPAEYLPTDLDPRKLVEPGNTFNAVITIKSAAADATGFKLNVCYRLSDGQLRCAIDDFK